MSEKNTDDVSALHARIAELEGKLSANDQHEQKRKSLLAVNTFSNDGRRIQQIRQNDPSFFEALFERPNIEDFFGAHSHSVLAYELKKRSPVKYAELRQRAVNLGLLSGTPISKPEGLGRGFTPKFQ